MASYHDEFPADHTLLPVIHVVDQYQAEANIELCLKCQIGGVFLINHNLDITTKTLAEITDHMKRLYPEIWIGLNPIGEDSKHGMFCVRDLKINGLWVNGGLVDDQPSSIAVSSETRQYQREYCEDILYFGGVAYKYFPTVEDDGPLARVAAQYMDVVTTSGPATGMAADPAKLARMREALGDFPLALASGVTSDNVQEYLKYVNCFLVATGISKSFIELDENKLRRLNEQLQ